MKFLLSILVIIGNLNVLLAKNDNCRENDLNALMVRLRALRTEFDKQKNVLEDLKEELKELRQNTSSEIAEIKEVIAFNVADAVNYDGNDTIKFSNIILNQGDAFNKTTGNFTVPIDGIYQFNAHICGDETVGKIDYHIKVNSQWIVLGEFIVPAGAKDAKCTSFSAVALVQKGENVRVGGMPYVHLRDYSNDYCSFSGVLIQRI